MKLYHGTLSAFNELKLINSKGSKDFGYGFYTTDSEDHAKSIASRMYTKKKKMWISSHMFIYSYDISIKELKEQLIVQEFRKGTAEWLDLVVAFRAGMKPVNSDVIIGPTADKMLRLILNSSCYPYFDEKSNKLNLTRVQKERIARSLDTDSFGSQYCFKTRRSLRWLSKFFIEVREII